MIGSIGLTGLNSYHKRIEVSYDLAEEYWNKGVIKVLGSNNVIEIWDKKLYEDFLNQDVDIEKLAEDVLGGLDFNDETE
jgi:DNA-binding transcriptional regulator/RsmH inhibitor MraZ